jgi:hypothetical protein
MTYFHTCVGCKAKGNCEQVDRIRSALKGTRVTSARHSCKTRVPMFEPGEAIMAVVTLRWNPSGEYGGSEPETHEYPGVFIAQKGPRALVYIRPGTMPSSHHDGDDDSDGAFEPLNDGKGYLKVPLGRVKKWEGVLPVDLTTCSYCGEYVNLRGCQCKKEQVAA